MEELSSEEVAMFQWIGISLVVAAWAVPILFALTLSFLFSFAVFRPLFLAWSHAWDAAAARLNHAAQVMAERVLSRTYVYAVRHTRQD
jgi:hypothetical protein